MARAPISQALALQSGRARTFAIGGNPVGRGIPVNSKSGQARESATVLEIGGSTCITPECGAEHNGYGPTRGAAKARATRRQEQRGRASAAMRPVLAGEEHRPPAAHLQQRPHRLGRHVDVDHVVEPAGGGHADETHKCETTEAPPRHHVLSRRGADSNWNHVIDGNRSRCWPSGWLVQFTTTSMPARAKASGVTVPTAPTHKSYAAEGGVVVHRKMRGMRGKMRVLATG